MSRIRIDRYLSEMGAAARSESKKLIRAGRVRCGSETVRDGKEKIDPVMDRIFVDDTEIVYEKYQYIMLHKPAGCVTATEDARQKTVMDFLPSDRRKKLAPAGRLDKDTEGLVLITDDGELAHRMLAPGKHVEKTYYVKTDDRITPGMRRAFREGIEIGEKRPTAPAKLEVLEDTKALVTITEGKYHQIRRMFEALGLHVIYLKRLSTGPLELDEQLQPGEWRFLTEQEIRELKESTNVKR